jgi:hypothetical protein
MVREIQAKPQLKRNINENPDGLEATAPVQANLLVRIFFQLRNEKNMLKVEKKRSTHHHLWSWNKESLP